MLFRLIIQIEWSVGVGKVNMRTVKTVLDVVNVDGCCQWEHTTINGLHNRKIYNNNWQNTAPLRVDVFSLSIFFNIHWRYENYVRIQVEIHFPLDVHSGSVEILIGMLINRKGTMTFVYVCLSFAFVLIFTPCLLVGVDGEYSLCVCYFVGIQNRSDRLLLQLKLVWRPGFWFSLCVAQACSTFPEISNNQALPIK